MTQTQQDMAQYRPNVRVRARTFTITEDDFSTVQWIAKELQTSNSEAVRTAIRTYAMQLADLARRKT